MRTVLTVTVPGPVSCGELEDSGLVSTSECCEVCHGAERYAPGPVAGPCRVALPDGTVALVCCASKRRVQEVTGSRGGGLRDGSGSVEDRSR